MGEKTVEELIQEQDAKLDEALRFGLPKAKPKEKPAPDNLLPLPKPIEAAKALRTPAKVLVREQIERKRREFEQNRAILAGLQRSAEVGGVPLAREKERAEADFYHPFEQVYQRED